MRTLALTIADSEYLWVMPETRRPYLVSAMKELVVCQQDRWGIIHKCPGYRKWLGRVGQCERCGWDLEEARERITG